MMKHGARERERKKNPKERKNNFLWLLFIYRKNDKKISWLFFSRDRNWFSNENIISVVIFVFRGDHYLLWAIGTLKNFSFVSYQNLNYWYDQMISEEEEEEMRFHLLLLVRVLEQGQRPVVVLFIDDWSVTSS